jgi:GGDEF domain-containing protein
MGRKARLPDYFIPPDEFAVLDSFATKVAKAFGCIGCAVLFYDAREECLRVLASAGLPPQYSKWEKISGQPALLTWVREAVTPLTINDTARQPSVAPFVLHPQARAMIWFPLFATGAIIGAMAAFHRDRNAFRGSDLELLDLAANQAAGMIELYLRLDEVTITDFLTGLRHGAYFEYRVREELERSQRYGHALSVVIVGVCRLIPGEFHGVSSNELTAVAGRITAVVRATDILTRHNDCVFAALLPETSIEGAQVAASKLVEEAHGAVGPDREGGVTTSVFTFPKEGLTAAQFLDMVRRELVIMGRTPSQ